MTTTKYPLYLANCPQQSAQLLTVKNKFNREDIAQVALADSTTIETAIAAATKAQSAMSALKPYQRQQILQHCVRRFQERADELAHILCLEAGKPIRDARGEVTRLIDTFRIAAEESTRINGQTLNLEISERCAGYRGMTKRVAIGVCAFISPFNFPLNLVAHKIAPAIAAGCAFILKPASRTPLGALMIAEILAETDLPHGAFSILPCDRKTADQLTTDPRIRLLSFTGSPEAGWAIKARAGNKKVVLELGGNAACIVDQDQHTNLDAVVDRVVIGAFYQSGQSCISVQRILVHDSIYDEFKMKLIRKTEALQCGDPLDESTFIGPLIDQQSADRLKDWLASALAAGAKLLCGGNFDATLMQATLLEEVPETEKMVAEEAFGPIAVLSRFSDFDQALAQVNRSRYGLQAGVFTHNIGKAMKAWDSLEVGGVIINDVPSWRVDHMPYGGVKDSGLGREGIVYAIEHMTELRLLVIRE